MELQAGSLSRLNYEELLAFPESKIGFYGGTFFPPHYGHLAVVESALEECLDFIVVSPHYHNPNKNQIQLMAFFPQTFLLTEATFNESKLRDRIFMLDPSYLIGIQNKTFSGLASDLEDNGIIPYIVIADEALKESYPVYMRRIRHVIAKRQGYEISDSYIKSILSAEYKVLKTLNGKLTSFLEEGARNVPKILSLITARKNSPAILGVGRAIFEVNGCEILRTNSKTISSIITDMKLPVIAIKLDDKVLEISGNRLLRTHLLSGYTGPMFETSNLEDFDGTLSHLPIDMNF